MLQLPAAPGHYAMDVALHRADGACVPPAETRTQQQGALQDSPRRTVAAEAAQVGAAAELQAQALAFRSGAPGLPCSWSPADLEPAPGPSTTRPRGGVPVPTAARLTAPQWQPPACSTTPPAAAIGAGACCKRASPSPFDQACLTDSAPSRSTPQASSSPSLPYACWGCWGGLDALEDNRRSCGVLTSSMQLTALGGFLARQIPRRKLACLPRCRKEGASCVCAAGQMPGCCHAQVQAGRQRLLRRQEAAAVAQGPALHSPTHSRSHAGRCFWPRLPQPRRLCKVCRQGAAEGTLASSTQAQGRRADPASRSFIMCKLCSAGLILARTTRRAGGPWRSCVGACVQLCVGAGLVPGLPLRGPGGGPASARVAI